MRVLHIIKLHVGFRSIGPLLTPQINYMLLASWFSGFLKIWSGHVQYETWILSLCYLVILIQYPWRFLWLSLLFTIFSNIFKFYETRGRHSCNIKSRCLSNLNHRVPLVTKINCRCLAECQWLFFFLYPVFFLTAYCIERG